MKKSDLVAGKHVVKLRNGDNYLAVESKEDGLILSELNSWCGLGSHNEDLTYQDSNLDIIKVGLIDFVLLDDLQNDNCIKWIWERDELKYNVGDCFKGRFDLHFKIIGKENGYYQIARINKYGDIIDDNYLKNIHTDETFKNFKHHTPIERPKKKEMTIKEIEDVLGYEIKVVE